MANKAHALDGGIALQFHISHHWPAASDAQCSAMVRTLTIGIATLLSGCMTTVSMLVDPKPTLTPQQLSAELSARYSELGLESFSSRLPSHYELGEWHFSPGGGFVGHSVRKGALWIWIAPAAGGDDNAPKIKEKIERLIAQIAPSAAVKIHAARTPDFR